MTIYVHDLFPTGALLAEIDAGYVRNKRSDDGRITVLNYSEKAQYENRWNVVTRNCRGLVVGGVHGNEVLARGFPKFFNVHEHADGNRAGLPPLPSGMPVDVSEKVDGSLGILVYDGVQWRIVTRGSADSEQAKYATEKLLPKLYVNGWRPDETASITYLFEIIYPANRIVVDYKGAEQLVFLAALDTATGKDVEIVPPAAWTCARRYSATMDHTSLMAMLDPAEEGYVLRWADGTRAKLKGAEYLRLHAIVTQCSTKTIWEALRNYQGMGNPMTELLDRVPDEFAAWVKEQYRIIQGAAARLTLNVELAYGVVCKMSGLDPNRAFRKGDPLTREERKEFASHATHSDFAPLRAGLFMMLDGKPVWDWAMDQTKPEYARPYTVEV